MKLRCRNCGFEFQPERNKPCPDCGWVDPRLTITDWQIAIMSDEEKLAIEEAKRALNPRWEYGFLIQPLGNLQIEPLDKLGNHGWELAGIISMGLQTPVFVFKRIISCEGNSKEMERREEKDEKNVD